MSGYKTDAVAKNARNQVVYGGLNHGTMVTNVIGADHENDGMVGIASVLGDKLSINVSLALYGMMMPLLSVLGKRTSGAITVVRREGGERDEAVPNRYSYAVGYEFLPDDGTVIPGNTKAIGNAYNAGISKGRASIRYLGIFPYFNALEPDTTLSVEHVILLAVGVFIVVINLCGRQGSNRQRWRRERSK